MTSTPAPDVFAPLARLTDLAQALASGAASSRLLTEIALDRIAEPGGQGAATFLQVDASAALAAADACDAMRRAGTVLSPLMGVPVSVKDLFDVAGQVTRAGSIALGDRPPAAADAAAVARLRRAGAVLIGRTNMSEFAFSGLGLNPHFGTPLSPFRRAEALVAGGSSSGAAVSVADGMAAIALGTDTGGSVRIPAALCGLAGFKPTARRIPSAGAVPLSTTLDSIGPLAPSVACCALTDRVLAGLNPVLPVARPVRGARIGVLTNVVLDGLEPAVADAYAWALQQLAAAGAQLTEFSFAPLDRLGEINRYGFSAIEALAWHRELIASRGAQYDQRVLKRILRAETATALDYLDLLAARRAVIAAAETAWREFEVVVLPTVALTPPKLAELESDETRFMAVNGLILRNPSIINFIDGCALTVPCHRPGDAPVGISFAGLSGDDEGVLGLGLSVQKLFDSLR